MHDDDLTADGGWGANPPLHLEMWLSDSMPTSLATPLARQHGERRRGGELLNFALCALVVVAFGCAAYHWITNAPQSQPSTSVCTLCPQR